jgi:2,3-bisphosphoglycerate-dependent phosphoglycerate mutase
MTDTVDITFLRHGRSRADDEGVHEGRYDSPLTDVGRAQLDARARSFLAAGTRFDRIVASPLSRAREAAQIVGRLLGVAVETDPDWLEMDGGPLAGLPIDVAKERYPAPAFRNPYEPFCGTGESDWEVYSRGARAVEKVVRRGAGRYLVVAHGGILNAALRSIAGAQPFVNRQGLAFGFGDAGYARLVYHPATHLWIFREFVDE